MNKVILSGRLIKDPTISFSNGGMSIARFNLAVNRKFKKEGQPDADFIGCVAFGKTAEFIEKYYKKGHGMELEGHIQTGSYEKDGKTVYTTDVLVEAVEFPKGNAKAESNASNSGTPSSVGDGFMTLPEGIEEELPFN